MAFLSSSSSSSKRIGNAEARSKTRSRVCRSAAFVDGSDSIPSRSAMLAPDDPPASTRSSTVAMSCRKPSRSRMAPGSSSSWAGVRLCSFLVEGKSPMSVTAPNRARTGAPRSSNSTDPPATAPCETPTRCSSQTAPTSGARILTASPGASVRRIARNRARVPDPSRGRTRHGLPSGPVARSLNSSRWREDARASASISRSMLASSVAMRYTLIAAIRSPSGGSLDPAWPRWISALPPAPSLRTSR